MPHRKTVRQEMRKDGIVEAAAAVFADKGFVGATLDDIAEKVGLSKPSLYYYIDGKDQLIADVLARVLAEIARRADDRSRGIGSPLTRLRHLAQAHVEVAVETPIGRLIISGMDMMTDNPAAAELLRRHEDIARELVIGARRAGELRDVDVICTVKLLYGALNNIPRWFDPASGPLDRIIDRTWRIFASGVELPADAAHD